MIYKEYVVDYGDTVKSIAHFQLGNDSLWREIVKLNNLKYPYIVDTDDERLNDPEHLVTIGDPILLPVKHNISNLQEDNDLNSYDRKNIYDTSLGMDLKVLFDNENDGIVVTRNKYTKNADFDKVVGVDNLIQSLLLRLLTIRGSLLHHKNYGSNLLLFLGQNITGETIQLIDLEITRTLTSDSRVAKASVTHAIVDGNGAIFDISVTPIGYDESVSIYISRAVDGTISIDY